MNIGDIFFTFRGDGARLQKDATVEGGKAGTNLGKSMAANLKKSWSGQDIGKGLVQGLGLAGGLGVANIVSRLLDVSADAVKMAREDAASQAALGSSLRANIPLWDGNTAAIEKVIASRQRLGFADDEQRLSLQRLLPVYKDVNEALKVQRAAMDLARFRKISLADATTQLITIEGGQYKGLKQLIGSTKNITSATQALAAVRKAAGDAAEDMAATDEGKVLAAELKQAEALEKLGYILLPLVTEGYVLTGEAAENLAAAFDVATGKAKATTPEIEQLAFAINLASKGIEIETFAFRKLIEIWQTAIGVGSNVVDFLTFWDNANGKVSDGTTELAEAVKGAAFGPGGVVGSLEGMEDAADDFRDTYRDTTGDVIRATDRMVDKLADGAQDIIDDFYDPIETRAELFDTRSELRSQQEAARNAKNKTDARNAADDIIQSLDDEASTLVDLGRQHKLTGKDVDRYEADVIASYKAIGKTIPAEVNKGIARLRVLAGFDGKNIDINVITRWRERGMSPNDTHAPGRGQLEFAEGGTVPGRRGVPVPIIAHAGERVLSLAELSRPVISVPSYSGYILPHVSSMAGATAGGGDTYVISPTLQGLPLQAESPADVVRELRRMTRLGLPPTRRPRTFKSP